MGHGHSSSRTDGRGDGSRSRLRVSKDGTALGPELDPRSGRFVSCGFVVRRSMQCD